MMKKKFPSNRPQARLAGALVALAIATVFAAGGLGGPTTSTAAAQVDISQLPTCDFGDFIPETNLPSVPTCTDPPFDLLEPDPDLHANECTYIVFEDIFDIATASDDRCFTALGVITSMDCAGTTLEVVGHLSSPPPIGLLGVGTLQYPGNSAILGPVLDDNGEPIGTPYGGEDSLIIYHGEIFIPIEDGAQTVALTLFGEAGTAFVVEQSADCGGPQIDVANGCYGISVFVYDDAVGLFDTDDVTITIEFAPAGGSAVVTEALPAGFTSDTSWSFGRLFLDELADEVTYNATVRVNGTDNSGGTIAKTFGPEAFLVERCVDVVLDCTADQPNVTATLRPNATGGARQVAGLTILESGPRVTTPFPDVAPRTLVIPLDPTQGYFFEVLPQFPGEGLDSFFDGPSWFGEDIYCLQFNAKVLCSNGQVLLDTNLDRTNPDLNFPSWLNDQELLGATAVTVNGIEPEAGNAPDYNYLFADPPPTDFTMAHAANSPWIQAFINPDIELTVPNCVIDAVAACEAGLGFLDVQVPPGTPPFFVDEYDYEFASPGDTATLTVDNGVIFADTGTDTVEVTVPLCLIEIEINCVAGAPNVQITSPILAPSTGLTVRIGPVTGPIGEGELIAANADGTYTAPNNQVLNVSADPVSPDIWVSTDPTTSDDDGNPVELAGVDCIVDIEVVCLSGAPQLNADPGSADVGGLLIGTQQQPLGGSVSAPFPTAATSVSLPPGAGISINDPANPQPGYTYEPGRVDSAVFAPPTCIVDPVIVCGVGNGGPTGQAEFQVDLTGTPQPPSANLATEILDTFDGQPVNSGDVFAPGQAVTVVATNGVWFATGASIVSENPLSSADKTLVAPFCAVTVTASAECQNGQAVARFEVSNGGDFATIEGAVDNSPPASNSGLFQFAGEGPIAVTLTAAPNALIIGDLSIDPLSCLVTVAAECVAGQAVLVLTSPSGGLDQAPAGSSLSPAEGTALAQNSSTTVTAAGVNFAGDPPSATTMVAAPRCEIAVDLACRTAEGIPTGDAALRIDSFELTQLGAGATVTPAAGTIVPSEGQLTVSATGGVHLAGGTDSLTLTAPSCLVAATATAACSATGVDITVTTNGAPAAAITVNGQSFPATGTTTTVSGLAPATSYQVAVAPANPTIVAASALATVFLDAASRCTIEIAVTVQCVTTDLVMVTALQSTGNGTVTSISVNGDTNLPFNVAPGTPVIIDVTSSNTLPGDISIPAVVVPTNCDTVVRELAATLYVDYSTACSADGQSITVTVTTEGSAGIVAMSINGDASVPYEVAPGEEIFVSVITYDGNDFVDIRGTNLAPVCLTPPPEPTPQPSPQPAPALPPAIILTFAPESPATPAAPASTPEPTPETTPEPIPEPTPEATPEPTPEATPEPTAEPAPEPTSDPAPESTPDPTPDPQIQTTLPVAVRQHGKSTVLLPDDCDATDIDLPGAVRLVRDGITDDGHIRFIAETATLDVGTYKETISCAGTQVEIELFVYRQIGGARGEASSISRLASMGGILALVLVGIPGLAARREDDGV